MSQSYIVLTYNGITKVVSNRLIETIIDPEEVITLQWFRYQLIKMCNNLNININEPVTKGVYNNITLANKIIKHRKYGRMIINEDDKSYGLSPCLQHKSIAPISANKSQLRKDNNYVTLTNTEHISWRCGVRSEPLIPK